LGQEATFLERVAKGLSVIKDATLPRAEIYKKEEEIINLCKFAIRVADDLNTPTPLTPKELQARLDEISEEQLEQIWRQEVGGRGGEEILGEDLVIAVENALREEMREDFKIQGSAADELRLAVELIDCLTTLGQRLSSADRRALLAAAHASGDAAAAAVVLKALAKAEPSPEAVQGPAVRCLADAMELGGWDRSSVEAFLAGQRPVPERAGGPGLGALQTRLLDPLKGFGDGDKGERAKVLAELMRLYKDPGVESYEVAVRAESARSKKPNADLSLDANASISTAPDKGTVLVNEADFLRELIPNEDQAQRLAIEGSLKWLDLRDKKFGKADVKGIDQTDSVRLSEMGIPPPKVKKSSEKLARMMHQITQNAERARRTAAYEVKGRNITAQEVAQSGR